MKRFVLSVALFATVGLSVAFERAGDLESGISLLEKHQYEEAVRVLRRAVGEAPNSPDAHNYYGFALARSGNLTDPLRSSKSR